MGVRPSLLPLRSRDVKAAWRALNSREWVRFLPAPSRPGRLLAQTPLCRRGDRSSILRRGARPSVPARPTAGRRPVKAVMGVRISRWELACAAGVGGLPIGLIRRRLVVRFHGRVLVLAPSANRPGRRPLKAEIGVRLPVELLTHSGRGVQRLAPLLREQVAEVRVLPARLSRGPTRAGYLASSEVRPLDPGKQRNVRGPACTP